MPNIDVITLTVESRPQKVAVTVPAYPDTFDFVSATMKTFAASMREISGIERVPAGFAEMLTKYYSAIGITKRVVASEEPEDFNGWEGDRQMVLLTGGKDSTLMLLECIAANGSPNVVGFYVDGVNRSEASYERVAVRRICEKHDVECVVAQAKVSGAMNRTGHRIGLRDELLLSMALPYARLFNVNTLAMGIHFEEHDEHAPTWGESRTAIEMWHNLAMMHGYGGDVITMPWDEMEIIERMVTNHMDTLEMSVSCYTQRNFRENQHARMTKKYPDSWVHPTGCGICNKCLRIQGVVAYHREDEAMLEYVMSRHEKDFPDEPTLKLLHDRIHGSPELRAV